jgi:hypothetical protein
MYEKNYGYNQPHNDVLVLTTRGQDSIIMVTTTLKITGANNNALLD